MTVTVLPKQAGGEATGPRGQWGMLRVELREETLGTPSAKAILDELPELLGPIDFLLGASNFLQDLRWDLHANDRSFTHGLP
ncbi:MAG: hypothetical protein L3K09_08260 [Thermoplasmata archaeon]|nr:hypothetical protein [Thermoplasmata archaeon]